MSKDEEVLKDAYYWLSIYKLGAITEGVAMERIKDAIFAKPTLNENQQIVLNWLKDKYTITDIDPIELFWRLHVNSKNRFKTLSTYRAYKYLTRKAQLEVLQAFIQWTHEQEEE